MGARTTAAGRAGISLLMALGLLAGCGESDAPDDELNPVRATEEPRIMPAEEVLAGANIPTLDPHTMVSAEVNRAIGEGPRCEFRYTGAGGAVVAIAIPTAGKPETAVVKLNGKLVILEPPMVEGADESGAMLLRAEPIRATVSPDRNDETEEQNGARRQEADMVFEVGESLRVGYRGYLDCMSDPPMRQTRR